MKGANGHRRDRKRFVRVLTGFGETLPPAALQTWIERQPWFASDPAGLSSIEVLEAVPLGDGDPALVVAFVAARSAVGTHDLYHVPLGIRPARERWDGEVIAETPDWIAYDALADPEHTRELLGLMQGATVVRRDEGAISFGWTPGAADGGIGDIHALGIQRANSSMVVGADLVLKSFRRLEPGVNPELELLRFLGDRGFEHLAPLAGWYEYEGRLIESTLGIAQRYFPEARNGWALGMAEAADGPATLLAELSALGSVTGRMHSVLASEATHPSFAREESSDEALALVVAAIDEDIDHTFSTLPAADERLAPVLSRCQEVRERVSQSAQVRQPGRRIRTHGDYHLGQVVLTSNGWVVLDFEGDPSKSAPERRRKRSALRDVAGMLRSLAYVTRARVVFGGAALPDEWEQQARAAFLDGWLAEVDASLLPGGEAATRQLLEVFELEKAVRQLSHDLKASPGMGRGSGCGARGPAREHRGLNRTTPERLKR
jgi:maltokinase